MTQGKGRSEVGSDLSEVTQPVEENQNIWSCSDFRASLEVIFEDKGGVRPPTYCGLNPLPAVVATHSKNHGILTWKGCPKHKLQPIISSL